MPPRAVVHLAGWTQVLPLGGALLKAAPMEDMATGADLDNGMRCLSLRIHRVEADATTIGRKYTHHQTFRVVSHTLSVTTWHGRENGAIVS